MKPVQTKTVPVESTSGARLLEQPQLSVAAAARRLGVAPATLRTWDRRYGIGPTDHTPGRHRRYSAVDVARLELMQHAMVRGASPVDAARYATTAPLPEPGHDVEPSTPQTVPSDSDASRPATTHVRAAGVALRLPGASRRAHGLARAALALDSTAVRGLIADAVLVLGVEPAWNDVLRPVISAIADRWQHSGAGVEIEHLLSECATGVFGWHASVARIDVRARAVLLAGMPGEQHVLPLSALSAALADRGIPCLPLGANLPVAALGAAVRRIAPSVVVLWAQLSGVADAEALRSLPRTRPLFRVVVAGPGWADQDLPSRVVRVDSLVGARAAICAAVPM